MPHRTNLPIEVKKGLYPGLFLLFLIISLFFYRLEDIGGTVHVLSTISGIAAIYFFIRWIILAAKHGLFLDQKH